MAVNGGADRRRIIVFGGTFDPIHNGHLAIARCLRDELDAEKVLVVPAGRPWLRDGPPVAAAEHRLLMAELAIEGEDRIEVSNVDVIRDGTTYSIDTIRDLRGHYGDDREYILAVGSDAAATLHRWHRYDELIEICTIAVIERPGTPTREPNLFPFQVITIRGPMVDLSGSEIRLLYASGEVVAAAKCVPQLTHRFIIENRLYQ